MRMKNTLTKGQSASAAQSFDIAIRSDAIQNMIASATPDADSAKRLSGALISIVSASEQLKRCSAQSIVAAALRGEGMGLTLGREYYVVPYGDKATYILGFKGLLALLISTGEVADTDCIEVREGEYLGRDRRTKRPSFDFSVYKTDEEAEKHPVIGYYAYVEMKSGYFRGEYMTIGEILNHATRYSKAFDREKYDRMMSGDMTPDEVEKLKSKSPWYGNTEMMMRKTVIRKLLNSGYVRLANSAAINKALTDENNMENGIIPTLSLDTTTGEVIEGTATVVDTPNEGDDAPETIADNAEDKAQSDDDSTDKSTQDFTEGFFQ